MNLPSLYDFVAAAIVLVGLAAIVLIIGFTIAASRTPATYPPPAWPYVGPFAGVDRLRKLLRAHRRGSASALRRAARGDDPEAWSSMLDMSAAALAALCDERTRRPMLAPAMLAYPDPDTCPEFLGAGIASEGLLTVALAEYAGPGVAAGILDDEVETLSSIFGARVDILRPVSGIIVLAVDYSQRPLPDEYIDGGIILDRETAPDNSADDTPEDGADDDDQRIEQEE